MNESLYKELESAFNISNYSIPINSKVTKEELLRAISEQVPFRNGYFDLSTSSLTRLLHNIFYDKTTSCRYHIFLLAKVNKKLCPICNQVLSFSNFYQNRSKATTGVGSCCKNCEKESQRPRQRAYRAIHRAGKHLQTPNWVNLSQIKNFYDNCPEGYHVDHIIPLNHELVSGLHVLWNLQYLPALDNIKKSNKFEIA